MNIKKKSKGSDVAKWRIPAVLALCILAVLSVTWFFGDKRNVRDSEIIRPIVTETPRDQVGKVTPQNIPLNGAADITQSYNAEYPDSAAKQSTIVFTSLKTPDENFYFYLKWAKENDWQIVNSSRDSAVYSLSLKKPSERMVITINKGTITISYVNLNK